MVGGGRRGKVEVEGRRTGRRKGGLELLMLEAGESFGLGGRSRLFGAFLSFVSLVFLYFSFPAQG